MRRISVFSVSLLAVIATCAVTAASAGAATNANSCKQVRASVRLSRISLPIYKAEADIEEGNGYCGEAQGLPVIGVVKYWRIGNLVILWVAVKNGRPDTEYKVQLAGNLCEELTPELRAFKTNSKGVGYKLGLIKVPEGDDEFFADIDTEGFHGEFENQGDTPYVSLP